MLGLKQGVVELIPHQEVWREVAVSSIQILQNIFNDKSIDMAHVGSTSIVHIKAKPIIDIAIGVNDFDKVRTLIPKLEEAGFIHGPENDTDWQLFFYCEGKDSSIRTHFIHVVKAGSQRWRDYIFMRDYLNANPEIAKEYETLKIKLMKEFKGDRLGYVNGKAKFIEGILSRAT